MRDDVRFWFNQAADLPAAGRDAFLDSQCADREVLREVRSLLVHDGDDLTSGSDRVLRNVITDAIDAVIGSPPAPMKRVGAFELGRILGSGGMGFVYEAHRVDGEVRQRVAVKFAQVPFTASADLRERTNRRFGRERQMLASLRHPYIAGLISAGTTDDGIPYAVIEQIDGVPIDVYCDAHLPDFQDRIRLVLKLCDAVKYAHGQLIVHSDIKPENVLVTADGIPKLIDFGVATDLGEDDGVTAMRAFTPGYASPEQRRGALATVATDIYGMGAVLYRLLTGVRPHGSNSNGTDPDRVEDLMKPSAIRPALQGDLENILLTALQPEAHRRYGSVAEFADDLNRFLLHKPVRATPDSMLYRTNRFLRRHWTVVLVIAVTATFLTGATIVSVRQRELAMHRADETRRLAGRLLFDVHDEIGGIVGGTKARETLGVIAVQYLEALERDYGRDPELAWELLNAYSRLGQSRGGAAASVGNTKSAVHFATRALELGTVVESGAPGTDHMDSLFAAYAGLVPIFEEAQRPRQRREVVSRMLRLAPQLSELRQAQALKEQGRLLVEDGLQIEAASVFARTAELLREHGKGPAAHSELITTLVNLGRSQSAAGDFASAMNSLGESIRLATTRMASDPHMAGTARQLYWSHVALGDLLGLPLRFNLGQTEAAVEHYDEARKIAQTLVAADGGNEMARVDLARVLGRQGAALAMVHPEKALEFLDSSEAVLRHTSPQNLSSLDIRFALMTSSVVPLLRLGRFERARQQVVSARRVLAEMRHAGMKGNERSVLKAEAIRLHAVGQNREALAQAQANLALLPEQVSNSLGENYETIEVLERIQSYSAEMDPASCAAAGNRLALIWQSLELNYRDSAFVRTQADRARASARTACLTLATQRF